MNGKIMAGLLLAAALLLSAAGVHRKLQNETLDRTGMENPNASLLELLTGAWESEDGSFSAVTSDGVLALCRDEEILYFGTFTFSEEGSDQSGRTALTPSPQEYAPDSTLPSCALSEVYVKGGALHGNLTIGENQDTSAFEVVLKKQEDAALLPVPDTAELLELSWYRNAMSYSDSFSFGLHADEEGGAILTCSYPSPEDGMHLETGEEGIPVPEGKMEELAAFLRSAGLVPYVPPDPYLADAEVSQLAITWKEQDIIFTNVCRGEGTGMLYELLAEIADEGIEDAAEVPEEE